MFFRGKALLLVILVTILLIIGCSKQTLVQGDKPPSAEAVQKLQTLQKAADELYEKTNSGDFAGARIQAEQIGNLLTTVSFQGITSAEGVKAIVDTVLEAKRTLNAASISPESAVRVSAKLRLAADALTHRNEPMWHQYDKVLQGDLARMEAAAQQQNKAELTKAFAAFEQHFGLIRPSILINQDPSQAEKGDSFVTFMKTELQTKEIRYAQVVNGVRMFSDHLHELFGMKREDKTAYIPMMEEQHPVMWTFLLGIFIIGVLSFAAWRMFPVTSGPSRIDRRNDRK